MNHQTTVSFLAFVALLCSDIAFAGEIYTSYDRHQRFGTINVSTGVGMDIGSFGITEPGYRLASGAFDVNGDFFSIAVLPGNVGSQLARVDIATGEATAIGPRGDVFLLGMEFDSNDTLYAHQHVAPDAGIDGDPQLFTVDKATGALTAIGQTGIERLMDLAFDSNGTLWAVGGEDGGNRLYTIDPMTGASTFETVISDASSEIDVDTGGVEIMGIMFDENDTLYATSFVPGPDPNPYTSPLFTLDTTSGLATVIGQTGLRLPHGGDYLVPEPTSVSMLSVGILVFLYSACRRKNQK